MDYLQLILSEAGRVFGDKAKAAAWLSQKRSVFQGRSALDTALDPEGVEQVLAALRRLEHGLCQLDVGRFSICL